MKIINYDSDLAYKQKEQAEKRAKEKKEEQIKDFKKAQKELKIACPIVFFILGFVGRLLFMWEINIEYVKLCLWVIYVLVVGTTVCFFIVMLSGGKSYIEDIKEHICYSPLTKYYLIVHNKVYKERTIDLDKLCESYYIKVTTVGTDDIVEEEKIYLDGFEVLIKAYIDEPEVDLEGGKIYLPYKRKNDIEKEEE